MPHKVTVGVVYQDKVVELFIDLRDEAFSYLVGAHLWFILVAGHLGAGYEYPVLTRVGCLYLAVEEECDMGVFLGLCYPELMKPMFG